MFDIEALKKPKFSWQTALSLAVASKLVYSDPALVIPTVKGWGFNDAQFLSLQDTQCFVATTSDIALLTFRGTESVGDWMTNIRMVSTSRPYGRLHKGFYRAYEKMGLELRRMLENEGHQHIYFCGHSLGGALANIAILELADLETQYKAGYTFGQPKTGKRDTRDHFNEHFSNSFYRFVNDGDIVPRVPPGYRHVKKLYELGDDSKLEAFETDKHDLSEVEFKALQAELEVAMHQYEALEQNLESFGVETEEEYLEGIIPGVAAHDMQLYISRLTEKVDNE